MTLAKLPLLLITLGDVAGVGPEIVARAWPDLLALCRPVVCGDAGWMRRGVDLVGLKADLAIVSEPRAVTATPGLIPCVQATDVDLSRVEPAKVSGAAG